MSRYRLQVTGVVQGVGFRWFVLRAARRLDLAGWVRNEADGSVEVAVQGGDDAVRQFVQELHRGPEGASVAAVRVTAEASGERLPVPFEIA